jgi:hypothetical protein
MQKEIEFNDVLQEFIITLHVPKEMSGHYTHNEYMKWTEQAVCVYINEQYSEYSLNHSVYLDYKDSLQVGQPIIYFDTREEAEEFASKYKINISYNGYKE